MDSTGISTSDDLRSRLRVTVAAIERELVSLSRQEPKEKDASDRPTHALTLAWSQLVHQLDLGPEPERRECPVCHNFGMIKATVCGFCWTQLSPDR
jgi:hypothetical protein